MQAFRKKSSFALGPHTANASRDPRAGSPRESATATSGTYVAVRSEPADTEPLVGGAGLDLDKIEGLRFECGVGLWRCDSERVARCIIDDAECDADGVDEDDG